MVKMVVPDLRILTQQVSTIHGTGPVEESLQLLLESEDRMYRKIDAEIHMVMKDGMWKIASDVRHQKE